MKMLAFVTSKDLVALTPSDQIAAASLQKKGLSVQPAVWDNPQEAWERFDLLLLRSPWDYHLKPDAFFSWLSEIEEKQLPLWNPPAVVRWNAQKTYLSPLAKQGVPTPPTVFLSKGQVTNLSQLLEENRWERAIVKPQISAGAFETWPCSREDASAQQPRFEAACAQLSLMVQPFLPEVVTNGEWSLIFLGGEYSHAVVKRPKQGDFRVQEEFGGETRAQTPSEEMKEVAQKALEVASLIAPLLYARVDLVETKEGPLLMELELIEPELFFGFDALSSERFSQAIQKILDSK